MNHYHITQAEEEQLYTALMSGTLYRAVATVAPQLPYHNIVHILDVARYSRKYALEEGLTNSDALVLETAAVFHDAIYIPGRKDNEEESAVFAMRELSAKRITAKTIDAVAALIIATKIPTSPKDIGEYILCDSDIDNLGREDFWEKTEQVRLEVGVEKNTWYGTILPKFLSSVKYYSKSAQDARSEGLLRHLEEARNYRIE